MYVFLFFLKFDVKSVYLHVRVAEGDEPGRGLSITKIKACVSGHQDILKNEQLSVHLRLLKKQYHPNVFCLIGFGGVSIFQALV